MAIISYKCSVCNRETDIVENEIGLETIGRCVITDGCRGKLSPIARKQDHIRGRFPKDVSGLSNWSQRKILFDHNQTNATQNWTIEHNLGVHPSVQAFNTLTVNDVIQYTEIEPTSITIVDTNTIIVNFSRPESGTAQLVARSSQPVVEDVRVESVAEVVEPKQISAGSELTLMTLSNETNIDFTLTFITNTLQEYDLVYTVDNVPSILSPWSDTDSVYFHGKVYYVRSFSLTSQTELTNGTIPDTSSFYIKDINTGGGVRSMTDEEAIIILADTPYTTYDKLQNKFVDPTKVVAAEAAFSFYVDGGNAFVYDNLIENVFPHIRTL